MDFNEHEGNYRSNPFKEKEKTLYFTELAAHYRNRSFEIAPRLRNPNLQTTLLSSGPIPFYMNLKPF